MYLKLRVGLRHVKTELVNKTYKVTFGYMSFTMLFINDIICYNYKTTTY